MPTKHTARKPRAPATNQTSAYKNFPYTNSSYRSHNTTNPN
ncbi:hypothetical protein AAHH79_36235 [Burkholderia pseudomallei]